MINVRAAQIHELKILIDMIKKMTIDELRYLRYNENHAQFVKRLGDNILNGTLILFCLEDKIIGYLEFSLRSDGTLWIFSLYFMKEYRRYVFTEVTPVFNQLKQKFETDIYFTVQPDNKAMKMLIHLIRAEEVSTYDDGRVEYVVKEVI